jgi:hypothetical protein
VLLDRVDDFAAGVHLGDHLVREPAAEVVFQRRDDLHSLQRVQPQLDDRRVQLKPDGPVLADRPDHVQHDLGRRFECLPAARRAATV